MINQEIILKINAREYEPKVDFPRLKELQGYKEQLSAYKQSMNEGLRQFEADVHAMLETDYHLNERQRNLVFAAARERGHASGFFEVLQYADEYAAFASDILAALKN